MGRGTAAALQRIERARQQERHVQYLEDEVRTHNTLKSRGDWETRGAQKAQLIASQQTAAALQAAREAEIVGRRQRLAEKLMGEQRAYLEEVAAKQHCSPQQRRAELADCARQLAATREAERARVAEEKLAQQFADNCDLLRTLNSQRITQSIAAQWSQQRAEHQQQRVLDAEQEKKHQQQFEQYMQTYEQRYEQDQQKKRTMQAQMAGLLSQQMEQREGLQQEQAEQERREAERARLQWQAEQEAARQVELQDHCRKQQQAESMMEANRRRLAEAAARSAAERAQDDAVVQEAMRRAAAEEAREAELKAKRKAEASSYREHLGLMMEKEQHKDAEREADLQRAFGAQQAKQEAEMAAREDARRKLMSEVAQTREQQLAMQRAQRLAEQQLAYNDRLRAEQEAAEASKAAEENRAKAYKSEQTYKMELQAQIQAKQMRRIAEQAEENAVLAASRSHEQAYQKRMANALQHQPTQWHGLRKFDSN